MHIHPYGVSRFASRCDRNARTSPLAMGDIRAAPLPGRMRRHRTFARTSHVRADDGMHVSCAAWMRCRSCSIMRMARSTERCMRSIPI